MKAIGIYLLAINAATFILYGVDKHRAKKSAWRISEKTLLFLPLIGGSVGALCGMHLFHHKTRHWYFRWGIPVMLLIQIGVIVYFRYFRG